MSKGYRAYKDKLRIEFLHRCAYCETREPEIGGSQSFHIDHYRPKNRFPELICTYENLIYSCRNCNSYKGDYWPNYLQEFLGKIIINPRHDQIDKHIDTSSFTWSGITTRGEWTVKKLKLDSPMLSQRREDRMRIEKKIQQLTSIVEDTKIRLENANLSYSERQNLEGFVEEESKVIESFKRKISGPMD
jgi:hypothetical protein